MLIRVNKRGLDRREFVISGFGSLPNGTFQRWELSIGGTLMVVWCLMLQVAICLKHIQTQNTTAVAAASTTETRRRQNWENTAHSSATSRQWVSEWVLGDRVPTPPVCDCCDRALEHLPVPANLSLPLWLVVVVCLCVRLSICKCATTGCDGCWAHANWDLTWDRGTWLVVLLTYCKLTHTHTHTRTFAYTFW